MLTEPSVVVDTHLIRVEEPMRIAVMMAIAVVLVAATGAAAEQPGVFGGLRVPPHAPASGRRNPYGRLFGENVQPTPRVAPLAITPKAPATPTVKCGMTLIPGDPQVDRGIAAPKPPDSQRFHSRAIEPTICR